MKAPKILITGLPHSGKSTLIQKLISEIPNKTGFITLERKNNGEREGFDIVTSTGFTTSLASTVNITPLQVSKYYVSLENLEKAVDKVHSFGNNDLLYIDEIGQMELYSEKFKELVSSYIDSQKTFIGSVSKVYDDNFIQKLIKRTDTELIEINVENRNETYQNIINLIK